MYLTYYNLFQSKIQFVLFSSNMPRLINALDAKAVPALSECIVSTATSRPNKNVPSDFQLNLLSVFYE